ncbi:hypothetical protein JK386_15785 [Nocardioides sp. zg-536]|uniref:Flp family type IVb pilin n=1 Tax=Nocardioides faecalis TaxID=2803858 RepID=A0A938YB16_9ACTN|nr:hypothetical protein [Nocardioides faecalis]MBM9461363.1 hypothetical protein [Nocardioides faecalis]QVI57632.1 hypothetical protein KG111_11095 [Nocardioides faecalis]
MSRWRPSQDRGTAATEYALLALLIAGVIVTAVSAFDGSVMDLLSSAGLLDALSP